MKRAYSDADLDVPEDAVIADAAVASKRMSLASTMDRWSEV
jgi:hypothetical protein